MSLYVFDVYPTHATVSADTRMCYQASNGAFYRLHDHEPKLYIVDDIIVTVGGVAWIGRHILQEFKADSTHTVQRLHEITMDVVEHLDELADELGAVDRSYRNNPFALELCILRYEPRCRHNVFYHIVTNQGYILDRFDVDGAIHPSARCYGGIDMERVQSYFKAHAKETKENYIQALIHAYESATSEKIGGTLMIAQQNKASISVSEHPLRDRQSIRDFAELMGHNIAGQNLIIECPDPNGGVQQFKVDSSGAVLNGGRFYIRNTKGAFGIDGNHGLMLGTTDLFEPTDTGYVLPICIDENGDMIFDDEGWPKNVNVWMGIDGKVYVRGNIYAEDGIFNGTVYAKSGLFQGTVQASQYLDSNGNSMMTNGQWNPEYLNIKGLTVEAADITGTLNANQINMTGAITWSDLSSSVQGDINGAYSAAEDAQDTADSAASTASSAETIAKQIAEGTYANGTFINKQSVTSPEIKGGKIYGADFYGNTFNIYPADTTETGSLNLYGYFDSIRYHMLQIYYQNRGDSPWVNFGSPDGAYAYWHFPRTDFTGSIDFSAATVTGLPSQTAVFL